MESSPDIESSPELSESFEMYLQLRKNKAEEERLKMSKDYVPSPKTSKSQSLRQSALNNTTLGIDNTMMQCGDDSFLMMEKMCEHTLHLNNVSENLVDLTSLDSSQEQDSEIPIKTSKLAIPADETNLSSTEAPSFLFNNTTMVSPNKHSPLITKTLYANQPSMILEVSEACSSKTNMSSYQTAFTRSGTEASEDFKTANEESFTPSRSSDDFLLMKMPKIRSFFDNADMTKDSLEVSGKTYRADELTKDSLDAQSYAVDSSSGVDSSYDQREDCDESGDRMNDTLEQIEYMLAQAQKLQEQQQTPKVIPASPMTPFNYKSTTKPKVFLKTGSASKQSPLIKFSPVIRNSPKTLNSAFKKPIQSSTTKAPQTSHSASKKFQHIESPISRYINHTPGLPLQATARALPGIGTSPKQFNFRDSESFANENQSMNATYKGSSLPFRAKTKSSAVPHVSLVTTVVCNLKILFNFPPQVYDHRDVKKIPGGPKMQNLLGTSPTVTVHQGHVRNQDRFRAFPKGQLNETALSEQSFADLSLFAGDVSLQVVEEVKRTK